MLIFHKLGKVQKEMPYRSKSITVACSLAIGDFVCQKLNPKDDHYDFKRTLLQSSFGFLLAPWLHLQFNIIMPLVFHPKSKFRVIKCVLWAQTICASVSNSVNFIYMEILNKKSLKEVKDGYVGKFLPTMYAHWLPGPFVALANFMFIPFPWKVVYANTCGIIWNIYLSYMQRRNHIKCEDGHLLIIDLV